MRVRSWKFGALAGVLLVAAVAVWQFKALSLVYYWVSMQSRGDTWQTAGVWLPFYRVTIDGRVVEGITKNASGLTFSKSTGTLFSVINSPPEIVELDTEGRLLRRIALHGTGDPEGITHVRDDIFVVSDERDHQLYRIAIGPETDSVNVADVPRMGLAIDMQKNLGFEGVSWDAANQRLFVTKEKAPLRVLTISGLPGILDGSAFNLQIREWKSSRAASLFMSDLSSLSFHERTGNLLLLSDESALIVEYSPDGRPVSMLPMWKGWHGLSQRVPQAEGLAMGPDGALYVLSEPNLFYRFEREPRAEWAD